MLQLLKEKTYRFLRWTERWTKTDMVYLTKGGFWLTIGQIFASLSGFLLSIAFANLLPKEAYGNYKYVLAIYALLTLTTLPGVNTALIRSAAKGFENSFKKLTQTKIKWSIFGAFASLGLAYYYTLFDNTALVQGFIVLAIFMPFIESFGLYAALLIGKKEFKKSSLYGILIKIISTVAIITAIFFSQNVLIILLTYFLSYTLLRIIFTLVTLKKITLNNFTDSEAEAYGKKLSLINIVSTIEKNIDKVLVFSQIGAVEMAIYSIAIAPTEQLKNLLTNIRYLSLPKLSTKSIGEIKKTIFSKIVKLLIILVIVTAAYIIAAPFIYRLVFPTYTDAIFYSQIYAITLLAAPVFITLPVLESQQAIGLITKFKLASSVIQISLLFIFFYFWGILGVILSRVTARLLVFILSFAMVKKMH